MFYWNLSRTNQWHQKDEISCRYELMLFSSTCLVSLPSPAFFQLINFRSSSSLSIGSCPPRVNDVSWRLQHHIKVFLFSTRTFLFLSVRQSKKCCLPWQNAHLDRVNEPFYTISMKTEVKLASFVSRVRALVAFFPPWWLIHSPLESRIPGRH